MHLHRIAHVSGIVALMAIATSAALTYAPPAMVSASEAPVFVIEPTSSEPITVEAAEPAVENPLPQAASVAKLGLPLSDALSRVTKKTFGMEVHPETSPVENDRFNGYHVGVDFETTEAEQDSDVPVMAICDGPLLRKQYATGYGGYALQSCELDGEAVIVLYGHLHLESIEVAVHRPLVRGQVIGLLGKGHSHETDGVRKHLHLGIHRGTGIDIRGYVPTKGEISGWIDVMPYLTAR